MSSLLTTGNDDLGVSLPLTTAAIRTANHFAQSQPNTAKASAIRLNTLAVLVMNDYCQMMAIPTDLENSDCWNPLMRSISDVADLKLFDIGQLECRRVEPEASVCRVPPEVWDLRLGYVAIEIDEAAQTAHLLGFTPTVEMEEIPIAQFQPIENLFDHLFTLQQASGGSSSTEANLVGRELQNAIANLGRWFNASFEDGWQVVEELLSPDSLSPALSFRTREEEVAAIAEDQLGEAISPDVRRAKLVNLALQLGIQQVVLIVEIQATSSQRIDIGLQVHPPSGQPYLPPDLEMAVLDVSNDVFMQVQSRQADNYIQLQFTGVPEEQFKVRLILAEAQYIEEFII